jgi:hypothetical protein
MSFIAVAIVGSAVVGGIASSSAANSQSEAAGKAADATLQANRENIDFQKWLYGEQKATNQPWYDAGQQALQSLQSGLQNGTFDPGQYESVGTYDPGTLNTQGVADPGVFTGQVDLTSDPGYQYRLQEGIDALDKSAASRGLLQSGAQAKAVTEYASDQASQEYSNAYGRALTEYGSQVDAYGRQVNAMTTDYNANANRQNTLYNQAYQNQNTAYNANASRANTLYNQLAGLSGTGQTAANANNSAAANMGSSVGNSTLNTGQALANMYTTQGTAQAQAAQGIGQSVNTALQNYLTYNAMTNRNY